MQTALRRLPWVLLGNALMRIAGGATGVLVGLYLADLSKLGAVGSAALAGTLGAVAFGAELLGAVPLGLMSDAWAPRNLMTAGAVAGAIATQLFGMTGTMIGAGGIFFVSRTMEGLGAAASAPSLLAHLTDVTDGNPGLRARVMSYFELSLLAGLALGGLFAGELWRALGARAFGAVALCYLLAGALLYFGAAESRGYGAENALAGFVRALREPALLKLAPIWLCVNSIVGLWLGPTLAFVLTGSSSSGQYMAGLFADAPHQVGWVLFGYSLIFGTGVALWSVVLPHMEMKRVLRIALFAMIGVCLGLYLFNHSQGTNARWLIGIATSVCIMVESGFTPAALSLLAGAVGASAGRGAAMGIYSVLLSLGAIVGSLLAGGLASLFAVDGLIYGTLAMAVIALLLIQGTGLGKQ